MKIRNILILIVVLCLAIGTSGCGAKVTEYKTQKVMATVTDKDYDAAKTYYDTVKKDGKTKKVKKTKSADYDTYITYNGYTENFDSKSVYDSVKKGQQVEVTYKEGFDKDGNVITRSISFE